MLPNSAASNLADETDADSVLRCDRQKWSSIHSDSAHVVVCQFSCWMRRSGAASVAALLMPVVDIVELCSKKQMVWVDARWCVAFMQHAEIVNMASLRNGASEQNPRDAMSRSWLAVFVPKNTVTGPAARRDPQPARVSFANVLKEGIHERFARSCYFVCSHATSIGQVVRGAAGIQALPRFAYSTP